VSSLGGEQGVFADGLAARTGLDIRVADAWVTAENNGGGDHNWLNVSYPGGGRGYSGVPASGGRFSSFQSVQDAITETAYWINQFSNYAGIRAAIATGDPQQQRQAIIASPWDEGHYMGGASFPSVSGGRGVPGGGSSRGGGVTRPDTQGGTVGGVVGGAVPVVAAGGGALASVGGVVHGILEDVTKASWLGLVDGAGGWSGISSLVKTPQVLLRMLQAMLTVIYFVTNRNNWIRVGEFLLGMILVSYAIKVYSGGDTRTRPRPRDVRRDVERTASAAVE